MNDAPKFAVMNGDLIPYEETRLHVMAPAVAYAANVFEGIRGYWNEEKQQLNLFRLEDHLERFQFSMRLMRFDEPPTSEELRMYPARSCPAIEWRRELSGCLQSR